MPSYFVQYKKSFETGLTSIIVNRGKKKIEFTLPEGKDHKDFTQDWEKWQAGAMIQDAFPYLSPDIREFLLNGITPEEWANMFGKSD